MTKRTYHPDDAREMLLAGEWLREYRRTNKINAAEAARRQGRQKDTLHSLERAVIVKGRFPFYSVMQQWTEALGLYFNIDYEGFDGAGFDEIDFAADDSLTAMRLMAGLGDGRDHWAVAAAIERLRVVRVQRGLTHAQVAELRGCHDAGGNHKRWEERSEDTQLYMLFDVARVLGGRARILVGDSFAGAVRVTG